MNEERTPTAEGEQAPQPDPQEREALHLLAQGLTERQVAAALSISEATLRRTLLRAKAALGANSTINAVYLATKEGLI